MMDVDDSEGNQKNDEIGDESMSASNSDGTQSVGERIVSLPIHLIEIDKKNECCECING